MTAIFAHRGHRAAGHRENTLEAFAAALRAGADGVELDVRMTADAQLAVHHDRQVPGVAPITNIPAGNLPPYVPLLGGALDACQGMTVNVEVKHEEDADPQRRVAELVGVAVAGREQVLVSSFDPVSLAVIRSRQPRVRTGLLVHPDVEALAAIDQALALGCATLHPFVTQADRCLVDAAGGAGLGLHVWTVNADADLAAMRDLDVDAVITDRLDAAIAIVRARGRGARNGGARDG